MARSHAFIVEFGVTYPVKYGDKYENLLEIAPMVRIWLGAFMCVKAHMWLPVYSESGGKLG